MREVPYYSNPNNDWCALACYTMVAQYLLPEAHITFEQFRKIGKAKKGYVVWAFPVWQWMMDQGIKIHNYDISDAEAWSIEGVEGLRRSVTPKEFEFYKTESFDLDEVTKDLQAIMKHPNFTYKQRKVSWDTIVDEFKKPGICDLTLDGRKLRRRDGFSVHRVVLIDITDHEVIFHDPNEAGDGAYKHESIEFFRLALESLSGPELCRYSLD